MIDGFLSMSKDENLFVTLINKVA